MGAAARGGGHQDAPSAPLPDAETSYASVPGAQVRPVPGTALITGASSGIGAAFARSLAARGHDLLLIARRATRLEALAADLAERHGVSACALPADLTTEDGVRRIEDEIVSTPDLTLLVNNAGFGVAGPFAEVDVARYLQMIDLHVVATVRLCHAALPGLLARRRGAIVNVSSVAGMIPTPGNATYAATKAYLNAFSTALAAEVRSRGVRVQALCPGFTVTEFHDRPAGARLGVRRLPRFVWLSADDVVACSLRCLERDRVICVPSVRYRALVVLARFGLAPLVAHLAARRLRHS
jgi:short-subunit dehydrogenase